MGVCENGLWGLPLPVLHWGEVLHILLLLFLVVHNGRRGLFFFDIFQGYRFFLILIKIAFWLPERRGVLRRRLNGDRRIRLGGRLALKLVLLCELFELQFEKPLVDFVVLFLRHRLHLAIVDLLSMHFIFPLIFIL